MVPTTAYTLGQKQPWSRLWLMVIAVRGKAKQILQSQGGYNDTDDGKHVLGVDREERRWDML